MKHWLRGHAGLGLVIFVAAVTALGILIGRPDGGAPRPVPIATVPTDNPRLGLVYQGLAPARHGTPCVGAYQVATPGLCTHGPDEPPAGFDVHRGVAPVAASSPTLTLARQNIAAVPRDEAVWSDAGAVANAGSTPAGAPAFVPDATPGTPRPDGVACDGDGRSGKRVQMLYVYQTGTVSRYSQYVASIRAWAAGVDTIFAASAAATGGVRHVRYVTTPGCEVAVAEVEVPAGTLRTFNATIRVLRSLGYQRADRKYLIFADATVYCGIGTFAGDDRPGPDNRNNSGPGYGRTDAGCWSPAMAAHELTHTLGAGARTELPCPGQADARLLDCGHDDYFNTDPKPGSYLATHWNVASSQFLIRGDTGQQAAASTGPPAGAHSGAGPGRGPAPAQTPGREAPNPPGQDATSPSGQDAPKRHGNGPAGQATTGPPTGPGDPTGLGNPTGLGDPTGLGNPMATHPTATHPAGHPAAGYPATGQPAAGYPAADSAAAAGPARTGPPASPGATGATSAASPVPLEVAAPTGTTLRMAWRPAGTGTRYGVLVNGAVVAWTTATAGRVIGLRPQTTYRLGVVTTTGPYTATATARTTAAASPRPGEWFTLANALTGAAATLYAARSGAGTPLVVEPDTGAANQDWQLQPDGDGGYLLRSRATGKCVLPRGGRAVPGAPLVQQSCPSLPAAGQCWRITRTAYGFALAAVVLGGEAPPGGPLVIGVGTARFGTDRLLVLQRPAPQRHQSWTVQ